MRAKLMTAVVLTITLLIPGAAAAQSAALPDIEDEVMCPICGTTLELSDAPQANRERELIRDLIAAGSSKEEIKDALVAEYGEEVLAVPDDEGFDLSAWVVPIVGLVVALGAGAFALARARRRPPPDPGAPLDPEDSSRLDRDLASYDT